MKYISSLSLPPFPSYLLHLASFIRLVRCVYFKFDVYRADGIKNARHSFLRFLFERCSTLNLFGNVRTRARIRAQYACVCVGIGAYVRRYFAIVKLVTYTLRVYRSAYTRSIALPRKKLNVLHVRAAAPATLTFRV